MNEQPLINLIGVRSRASPSQAAGTPGPPLDTRARMPRFTRAFSMVRTVMRRAAPPAALGPDCDQSLLPVAVKPLYT